MDRAAEDRALLAMHLVPGIGPKLSTALVEHFGSATEVLQATAAELTSIPFITPRLAEKLQKALSNDGVDAELELLGKHRVELIRIGTDRYPANLATVEVPPPLLYMRGTLEVRDSRAVALVGSRSCSSQGRRMAEVLGRDLARAGWTVISGLARGIDACAHRGALEAGGRTIAVLAGGLSKIYPPEHAELADQVAQSGALITESAMRMEPMAGMFPARNRIISGMSRAIVIVEAAERSGALITAQHAAEQGRETYALPWAVDNAHGGGCLKLLRDGARLIRHAGDLLEDLREVPEAPRQPALFDATLPVSEAPPGLDDKQRALWEFLSERRNVDDMAQHLQMPTSTLSGVLMTLELKRVIRRLPGNMYERV